MNERSKSEREPMKISEYIKSEKEKIKEKSFKERLAYFWEYSKWYVLIGLVAVVLLTQTVVTEINKKDVVLKGILIDGTGVLEEPAILQEFYRENGFDPAKQEIYLNTGLALNGGIPSVVTTSYQRIHAGIGAEDTDFLMGYEYAIQRFAYDTSRVFADLRDILSAETLAELEAYLYYVDASVIEKIKNAPKEEFPLPDPKKPEEMGQPVPVAVDISACKEFASVYYTPDSAVYIAVVTNAPHKELTARFIEHLLF